MHLVSLLFLAGGTGQRMNRKTPKQFIPLKNKPIALYSFELLSSYEQIFEAVVVCEKEYEHLFSVDKNLTFARPGKRRQDSVSNALERISEKSNFVCIHDSARPFVEKKYLPDLFSEAFSHGAAALGIPAVNTIKKCTREGFVESTLDRDSLFEMQTPQVISVRLLRKGYEFIQKHNLSVTDDLSLIEAMNLPSKVVQSSAKNFKITTELDLILANAILDHEKI